MTADQLSLDDIPRARRRDRQTSYDAARSVTDVGHTQRTILRVLALAGRPLADPEISVLARELGCHKSDAGIRSRRSELTGRGLGRRGGHRSSRWECAGLHDLGHSVKRRRRRV